MRAGPCRTGWHAQRRGRPAAAGVPHDQLGRHHDRRRHRLTVQQREQGLYRVPAHLPERRVHGGQRQGARPDVDRLADDPGFPGTAVDAEVVSIRRRLEIAAQVEPVVLPIANAVVVALAVAVVVSRIEDVELDRLPPDIRQTSARVSGVAQRLAIHRPMLSGFVWMC